MTFLAAVFDGADTILVAADSKQYQGDNRGYASAKKKANKLYSKADLVVWGYAGDTSAGIRFHEAMEEITFSGWDDLMRQSTAALARINFDSAVAVPGQYADFLLAGFVDNQPHILVADHHATELVAPGRGAAETSDRGFCGWGRIAADIAWEMTPIPEAREDFERHFEKLVNGIVSRVADLEGPITMWSITRGNKPLQIRFLDESH